MLYSGFQPVRLLATVPTRRDLSATQRGKKKEAAIAGDARRQGGAGVLLACLLSFFLPPSFLLLPDSTKEMENDDAFDMRKCEKKKICAR